MLRAALTLARLHPLHSNNKTVLPMSTLDPFRSNFFHPTFSIQNEFLVLTIRATISSDILF